VTNEQLCKALADADWSGVSIGNKALIAKAVQVLEARHPAAIDKQEAVVWPVPLSIETNYEIGQTVELIFESDEDAETFSRLYSEQMGDKLPQEDCNLYTTPLANEASKPAPSVEQDEHAERVAAFKGWFSTAGIWNNAITKRAWLAACEWMQARAASTSVNVGELDPVDALRYMACRESAIERGLFASPEEYDAMVDDSLRKKGKEVLTGRGHNYGKKVAKDGSLYRPAADTSANVAQPLSIMRNAFRVTETEGNPDPEKQRFHMRFTFRSMEELHAADDQWRAFISGSAPSPANLAQGAGPVLVLCGSPDDMEATVWRWRTSWGGWTYRKELPAGWRDLPGIQAYRISSAAPQPAQSANVAQGAEAVSERIARALHYPACWDTAAYPTLESAAWEAIACAKLGCSTCGPAQKALTDDALRQAAPDLLDALMAYQQAYDENPHLGPRGSAVDQAFIKARAAIEKATGDK
jgi:hypothetical protein